MSTDPVILVVEDEALIRLSVAMSLRDLGWEVIEAGNADEAMNAMDQCGEISLIFTDIDMPGAMNGLGLAHAVSERWPIVVIVITSGMNQPTEEEIPAGAKFVPKPYVPEILSNNFHAYLRS